MSRFQRVLSWIGVALGMVGCSDPPPALEPRTLLSASAAQFTQAVPGMVVELPQDLGPHPAFRLEWWYLTANLHTPEGAPFGLQWTLFRIGLQPRPGPEPVPGWHRDEFWLAHAALSRPNQHLFASKRARGGTGQAGVMSAPFTAWIDQWQLSAGEPVSEPVPEAFRLVVEASQFAYRITLAPRLPAVLHGERGFSAKSSAGGGSMYFSYPALAVSGEVEIDGERFEVTGQGWFDREWSSQYLLPEQQGWDWFALHLADGRHLMLFRIRGTQTYFTGTLIQADGRSRSLLADELELEPTAYRHSSLGEVPVQWQLAIPGEELALEIHSWPGDFSNPGPLGYWEGPVSVQGSHRGEGYLEMTGYR